MSTHENEGFYYMSSGRDLSANAELGTGVEFGMSEGCNNALMRRIIY